VDLALGLEPVGKVEIGRGSLADHGFAAIVVEIAVIKTIKSLGCEPHRRE